MKINNYSFQADILRVVSAIGVVVLHSFDSIYFRPDFLGGSSWWVTHLILSFFRTVVPIFIILSGYLNLGKQRTHSQTIQKLKQRIVIPFFSFFALLLAYDFWSNKISWQGFETIALIYNRFNINTQSLLYFLIILFFLYIITPYLNIVFTHDKKTQLKIITGFTILGAVILLARLTTFAHEEYFYNTYNTWISYIGYYLIGFYIKLAQFSKKQYLIFMLFFVLSYVTTVLGTYFMFVQKESISAFILVDNITYFSNYQSINVIVQSITLFILVIKSKQILKLAKKSLVLKTIQFLALNSFGIFLIHQLVLYIINLRFDEFFSNNIFVFLASAFISCYLVSLLITHIIRKSPLKFILGE